MAVIAPIILYAVVLLSTEAGADDTIRTLISTPRLKSTAPNLNVPNGNSGAMKANIESSSDSKKRWTKFDLVKCRYCMTADLPSGHGLYNMDGDVVCPVLSKYQCPFCNATGTKAHTLKYCPQNPILRGDINNIKKLPKGAAPDYHRLEAFR
ncbi:hypothetical protein HAZT_HAZT010360 [Hyalella azteca]|uniref:Nanos-type domain-containing protein n=1 Tax=Hyalella azteca TaxID=294128 RepID=A0A6A0H3D9_HYAAZ|nr:hypothetical protein HAZT_HAZT010360 [Hyalella azteca]